ncbi:hypothetical protein RXV94_12700 [Yeosuana sp. MJ-SS3]|uniref:Outer membrane protein beta-barrel domain-containing protein n=1 Tax=Gilvirhabdus luticola TaxID=3079858 RepID=A0ABU3U9M7_9FLAO|nr:hypothetical protein [Yeosuana sp. MJ-SS3]MDU8887021.1 hypothetical protein [Yeosuana sp. MJ-SS3]
MKKLFFLSIALIGLAFSTSAQNVSPNAIGLRMGGSDGFGAEISYQRGLDADSRLEFDLGWRSGNDYDAFKITGLYQWVMHLDGNFNWYVGAGGGLASFSGKDVFDGTDDTSIFVAGDIGVEYDFEIPLLISLDFRPEIGFGDFNDDFDFDIALGIRYQF